MEEIISQAANQQPECETAAVPLLAHTPGTKRQRQYSETESSQRQLGNLIAYVILIFILHVRDVSAQVLKQWYVI